MRNLRNVHLKTAIPRIGHGRIVQKSNQRTVLKNRQWLFIGLVKRNQDDASSQPLESTKL